jgi:nucleoside-diphosphate-sugar epimerase
VCLYAATKKAFEDIIQLYVEMAGLKVITLKLFDTYGPNDPRGKLFSLLEQAWHTQNPLSTSEGEQFLDLVYIDDVVEAYIIAADRLIRGLACGHEIYAVSSKNPTKLRDVVALFEKEIQEKIPILWGERPYHKRQVMHACNLIQNLPGWQAKIDLIHGIERTVRGMKN